MFLKWIDLNFFHLCYHYDYNESSPVASKKKFFVAFKLLPSKVEIVHLTSAHRTNRNLAMMQISNNRY